ncbi:MAG: SRPBCC family protein [Acidimicrobiia bacterium]|nr:SRPBCC family protein [Acidimicrobiia bacterium]MDH5521390.1 SRPBCC family protein [Acidimicrobiia bacterium]
MAKITFEVHYSFGASPRTVWDELIDWKGHEKWIPLTRVDVEPGDPSAVGSEFTAWTGVGPASLEDRMRVKQCDWDDGASTGYCEVDKLGPILQGVAGFTVEPGRSGGGADLVWFENVSIRFVPQFLAPVLAAIGAGGFKQGMRRLDKLVGGRGEGRDGRNHRRVNPTDLSSP